MTHEELVADAQRKIAIALKNQTDDSVESANAVLEAQQHMADVLADAPVSDGYIKFTITGRFKVNMNNYFDEQGGRAATTMEEALSIDQRSLDEGHFTAEDLVEWCDDRDDLTVTLEVDKSD